MQRTKTINTIGENFKKVNGKMKLKYNFILVHKDKGLLI